MKKYWGTTIGKVIRVFFFFYNTSNSLYMLESQNFTHKKQHRLKQMVGFAQRVRRYRDKILVAHACSVLDVRHLSTSSFYIVL